MAQPLASAVPRPRLLLTEDEPLLREAIARFFDARGYAVEPAGSLAESLELFLAKGADCFDAAIVDVGLPDGDGLELLDRVPPDRVVVISANPLLERYARRAVRHHLAKPVDLEALARAVDALVGRACSRVEP